MSFTRVYQIKEKFEQLLRDEPREVMEYMAELGWIRKYDHENCIVCYDNEPGEELDEYIKGLTLDEKEMIIEELDKL